MFGSHAFGFEFLDYDLTHVKMTKSTVALLFLLIIGLAERTLSQSTTAVTETESTPAGVYAPGVCICVTQGYCGLAGGGGSTDGAGQIDPRIMTV